MTDPTLNGIGLGKLQGIRNELNGNIIPLTIPGEDSSGTETFDMLGVTRTISLNGIFVGTTSDVKDAVELIEALVNSPDGQEESVPFVSDETGTYQVKVASVGTNWAVDGVSLRCEYSIMLIQGA